MSMYFPGIKCGPFAGLDKPKTRPVDKNRYQQRVIGEMHEDEYNAYTVLTDRQKEIYWNRFWYERERNINAAITN